MSAHPDVAAGRFPPEGPVECWCCGTSATPDRMVHLGNHPEVRLCPRCAHFVHQQAWKIDDQDRHGPAAVARDTFRDLRAEVMRRGWHHNRFIGNKLRWLGKHLP